MSTSDAESFDAAHPEVDTERAARLDAALEDAQREERSQLVHDITRQQATDDRIVDALTRAQGTEL
jgi:hypothetical protein